jgi:hypothetical protein
MIVWRSSVFDDKDIFVGALHVVLLAGDFLKVVIIGKEVVEELPVAVDLRLVKDSFALQAVQLVRYDDVLFQAVAVKESNPNGNK